MTNRKVWLQEIAWPRLGVASEKFVIHLVETTDHDVNEVVAGTVSVVEELFECICSNNNLPRIRVYYPRAEKTIALVSTVRNMEKWKEDVVQNKCRLDKKKELIPCGCMIFYVVDPKL